MPPVDDLTEVPGRDPVATLTEHAPLEILTSEHDADQIGERIGWAAVDAEPQINESQADQGDAAAPARSVRRATARRASNRRATARNRQGDIEASVIDFLAQHPGSTAGDLAKGLNLDAGLVSTRLTQLAKTGEIKRASHGYRMTEAARPHAKQRRLRRSD